MSFLKSFIVLALLVAVAAVALVTPPILYGQGRLQTQAPPFVFRPDRSEIGVAVREADGADAQSGGVVVAVVEHDSPAEKAGVKQGDIIVSFGGERVRSVRQFSRLVQETAPGRPVTASILREGKPIDIRLTPSEDRRADWLVDGDRLRDRLGEFSDRVRAFGFDAEPSRPQLGVTVQELTPQLAAYFGSPQGVLVSAVTDASPAARGGLKAGDVIASFNGNPVRSRIDLMRAVGDASSRNEADVSIGIVRDKKESSLKVRLEPANK